MATETDHYATKQDLYDLRGALREEMAGLSGKFDRLEGKLDTFVSQQTEVNAALLPTLKAIAKHLGVAES